MSKFLCGNARLEAMLGDHEARAEVDAIVDEMRQIDLSHKMGREPHRGGEDAGQGSPGHDCET